MLVGRERSRSIVKSYHALDAEQARTISTCLRPRASHVHVGIELSGEHANCVVGALGPHPFIRRPPYRDW